jgi:hypothetical protein
MTKRTLVDVALAGALGGVAMAGCSHSQLKLDDRSQQAVSEAHGRCPTDLNQAEVALEKLPDGYAVVFRTRDDSQRFALFDRAKAEGEALSVAHNSINASGQLVKHTALPVATLEESPKDETGYGVRLAMHDTSGASDARDQIKSDLEDHLRLWASGECPELDDHPTKGAPEGSNPVSHVDR